MVLVGRSRSAVSCYAKGLGVHAVADVVYVVPSGCTSFAAQVGVDDEVGANGSVVFEVWVDGARRVSSPRLTGARHASPRLPT